MKSLYCSLAPIFFAFTLSAQGPALREAIRLNEAVDQYGVSGEGVIIVMIDRGIDYRHPDFIDEEGHTRIAYIYDMTDNSGVDDPNNIYGIGTIYNRDQINAALEESIDPLLSVDRGGHGTATTGIMAGNGSGTEDRRYQGVAPKATIISIKITKDPFPAFGNQPAQDAFFNALYILDALEFAHDKIVELGMPSVTLMNIGSIGGPTDGTSRISRAIDAYVAMGHPFVCGVGDDGGEDNYASGNLNGGETIELVIEKKQQGLLRFDLWYREDDRFSVAIRRPNGFEEGPFSAPFGRGDNSDQNMNDIQLYHRGADKAFFGATSERREILIDFNGQPGTYTILLTGENINADGSFQATLNPSRSGNGNRFLTFVQPGHSINDYASALGAISPTDYVVTTSWMDQFQNVYDKFDSEGNPGELWTGASAGPTHDGRLGVDFATPGEIAIGAYYPNTWYANFSSNIVSESNGLYGIQNAVSASAPVATGIIALVLEINPDLTPEELRNVLHHSCRQDEFTGDTPNVRWGHGKLDALLAIQNAQRTVSASTLITPASNIKLFPNPAYDVLNIQSQDKSLIHKVEVFNSMGQRVYRATNLQASDLSVTIAIWPEGMYTIQVYQEGRVPSVGKVIVR